MTARERLANLLQISEQVTAVAPQDVPALLAELEALRARLWTRLLATDTVPPADARQPDRLLTPAEAAAVLSVPLRWIYRHHNQLPFTRRMSRKRLRFSEAGVQTWIADRHGRQGPALLRMKS
jgi:excisionase family DNA binding protein